MYTSLCLLDAKFKSSEFDKIILRELLFEICFGYRLMCISILYLSHLTYRVLLE